MGRGAWLTAALVSVPQDRVDEALHFKLPDAAARGRLARLYFAKCVVARSQLAEAHVRRVARGAAAPAASEGKGGGGASSGSKVRGYLCVRAQARQRASPTGRVQAALTVEVQPSDVSRVPAWRRAVACARAPRPISLEGVTDKDLEDIAARTEQYSGREIAKLFLSLQARAHAARSLTRATGRAPSPRRRMRTRARGAP